MIASAFVVVYPWVTNFETPMDHIHVDPFGRFIQPRPVLIYRSVHRQRATDGHCWIGIHKSDGPVFWSKIGLHVRFRIHGRRDSIGNGRRIGFERFLRGFSRIFD